jgi:flagellar biosynthesis protein FlhA
MADIRQTLSVAFLNQRSDILVAAGVIIVVMMLIIPLPTVILDVLLLINLTLSIIIILTVLFSKRALDFSVFPTLLLVVTVFGLALNVSSTRLILSQGENFSGAVIRAFSEFVTASEGPEGLVIGFIIFIVLIAVQFIVITKGATRVAEVAARFTLDSLPGKQMAIEAEYNSGALTETEAQRKKNDLQKEVDFYGAMDGASKFVSGNVQVGLLITAINVIGGIVVGMVFRTETFTGALNNYISLSIGDGLVSQFPALLVSTSTGLIVTRAISDGTFGQDVESQFTRTSRIYWISAAFLFVLAFLPGFPPLILISMSLIIGFFAYRLSQREAKEFAAVQKEKEAEATPKEPVEMSPVVPLDPISLELGYGLIPLVDKDQGAELLDRVTRIRREAALDLGLVVPRIRIIDNMRLEPSEYCVKIKGVEVGKAKIRVGHFLCINPGHVEDDIPGENTIDPAFGLPAKWVTEENRDEAERAGYTVVDSPSIIATHLTEIIKRHAAEIIGRQEVQSILDTLKQDFSAVVDEVRKALGIGEIQKILQKLLTEQVSIRNMVVILETIADYAPVTKDITFLVEKVRQSLGRQICFQYADEEKVLRVMTVPPVFEQELLDAKVETPSGFVAALEPQRHRQFVNAVANAMSQVQEAGHFPIILCSEAVRSLLRSVLVRDFPDLIILSVPELAQEITLESLGEITVDSEV